MSVVEVVLIGKSLFMNVEQARIKIICSEKLMLQKFEFIALAVAHLCTYAVLSGLLHFLSQLLMQCNVIIDLLLKANK